MLCKYRLQPVHVWRRRSRDTLWSFLSIARHFASRHALQAIGFVA